MTNDSPSLRDYLFVAFRRKTLVAAHFLLVVLLTVAWTLSRKPLYRAKATLLIDWSDTMPIAAVRDWINSQKEIQYLRTQAEIVKSRVFMEKLAQEFHGVKKPEGSDRREFEKEIKRLQKRVDVDVVSQSNLINIRVLDEDPQIAAQMANALAGFYKDSVYGRQEEDADVAANFLRDQSSEALQHLEEAENALKAFKATKNIGSYDDEVKLTIEGISELETMLATTFADSTDRDPRAVAVRRDLNARRDKLAYLLVESSRLAQLQRYVRINEEIYKDLQKKLAERHLVEGLGKNKISDVRREDLVDPAIPPLNPAYPRTLSNIFLAVIVGLAGGIALAFVVDSLQSTFWDEDQVEDALGLSVFATIPHLKSADSHSAGNSAEKAYDLLVQKIDFLIKDQNARTWLITGNGTAEGKSLSLFHLSRGLALSNARRKILLVDTNIRNPVLDVLFKIPRSPGLSEALIQKVPLDQAVHRTDIGNLFVLPIGSYRFGHWPGVERMAGILAELKQTFDVLLLDSPALGSYADALALAREADKILYVLASGRSRQESARRALQHLRLVASGKLIGAILTRKIRPIPEKLLRVV